MNSIAYKITQNNLKPTVNKTVQEFIEYAYLDKKISRLSKGIISNIEKDRSTMPAEIFNTYQKIIIRFFNPNALIKEIKKTIFKHYDDHKITEILHFMQQPKIILITQKEDATKSLPSTQEMQNFFTELQPPHRTTQTLN